MSDSTPSSPNATPSGKRVSASRKPASAPKPASANWKRNCARSKAPAHAGNAISPRESRGYNWKSTTGTPALAGWLLLEGVGQFGQLRLIGGGPIIFQCGGAEVEYDVLGSHGAGGAVAGAHQPVIRGCEVEQPAVGGLLLVAGCGYVVQDGLGVKSAG